MRNVVNSNQLLFLTQFSLGVLFYIQIFTRGGVSDLFLFTKARLFNFGIV